MRIILRLAEEIAKGLAYMHSLNVLHRDITSRNILLKHDTRDGELHAKVSVLTYIFRAIPPSFVCWHPCLCVVGTTYWYFKWSYAVHRVGVLL